MPQLPGVSAPPVRVAFVVHAMQVAGAEVLVAETIRRLGTRLAPVIFCLDKIGQLGERLQSYGTPVVCLQRRPGLDWRIPWRMARELRRHRIEIIHAHQYTPFFYSALARAAMGGKPRLMFTEHGRHFPDVVGRARRWSNRLVLAHLASETNAVCGFSARALQTVEGFSGVTVDVIENGIDPERYQRPTDVRGARLRVGLPPERRYVANVARFHPVKDHETLLQAFSVVASARPDVDLLLVGGGPRQRELETQVEKLGLTRRVLFLGVRSDVPAILAAADAFCLTSTSEAASLTLLEAMASGLPVVVTNVGGNPEIVRHEVEGILVARRDPEATAAALLRILDDPELGCRLGQEAAAHVRGSYQLNRTVERYYEAYQRLSR